MRKDIVEMLSEVKELVSDVVVVVVFYLKWMVIILYSYNEMGSSFIWGCKSIRTAWTDVAFKCFMTE